MNTSKQVNVMIGLMFVTLIGILLYFIWDDVRADDAEERQIVENAERGGELFSLNCRACHGVNGLASVLPSGENPNLPGALLNLDSYRGIDPETGEFNLSALLETQARVLDTIRCGRVGTLMPQWAEDQGGPLNDFQIEQLVALITGAMPGLDEPADPSAVSEKGWEAAIEEAEHTDLLEGVELAEAASPADTVFVLTDVRELTADTLLRIEDEVVRIVDVSVDSDGITVERADFATEAAEHAEGTQVFAGPIEPPTGPLTGEDQAFGPCGQRGVTAPSPPSGEPIVIEGEVTMEMGDNFFQLDDQRPPALQVSIGQEATIDLVNNGQAIHNMHIAGVDNSYEAAICEVGGDEACSEPAAMSAADTGTITFSFDQAGTFDFRCDFHPVDMTGQIVVVE